MIESGLAPIAYVDDDGTFEITDDRSPSRFHEIYAARRSLKRWLVVQRGAQFFAIDLLKTIHGADGIYRVGRSRTFASLQDAVAGAINAPAALEKREPYVLFSLDQLPSRLIETQVFYLGYGRNAWHTTWVNKYNGGNLSFDLDEMKEKAEEQRVQGSVFKIEALPMIIFEFPSGFMLFVCEINIRPKKDYYDLLETIEKHPLLEMFQHFPVSDQNWLLCYTPFGQKVPQEPFARFSIESSSRGSHHYLDWRSRTVDGESHFFEFGRRLALLLKPKPPKRPTHRRAAAASHARGR